jgi:Tfp pilus assembly ATPase PilU
MWEEKMRLIEQKNKFNIENVDVQIIKKPSRHDLLLPDSIRGIFVGPSGSGKTNVIFNFVSHRNELRFENIYLYSKTPNQEKYRLL